MTPEQITILLNIISDLPVQALLVIALYRMYTDVKDELRARLEWLSGQLTAYMGRDREIISNLMIPKVETASKYTPTPRNGNPPATG